jgi:hypothetical protein
MAMALAALDSERKPTLQDSSRDSTWIEHYISMSEHGFRTLHCDEPPFLMFKERLTRLDPISALMSCDG